MITQYINGFECSATKICLVIGLLLCSLAGTAQQNTLTARLDRSQMTEGETVNLIIERRGDASQLNPDLRVLEEAFDVLNTSSQTQVSIANGRQEAVTQFTVVLIPKQAGKLTVPPITADGQQTEALSLTVSAAPQAATTVTAAGEQAPEVLVEVETSSESAYVQAQVTLVVRLLIGVPLTEATLSEPSIDNAVVEKIGEDVRYESQRFGRRYSVVERNYAIFPQQSGQLNIPPIQLAGWSGGNSRGGFFNSRSRGRRITHNSEATQLTVLPVPSSYSGEHWIPANGIYLRELAIDRSTEFRVGEPLTRTLELTAQGLSDIMLPDIQTEVPDGARIYADKPVGVTRQQEGWIIGRRTIKQAIVPTVEGTLVLPSLELDWWDTNTNQQRQAIIPATVLNVLPALDANNQEVTQVSFDDGINFQPSAEITTVVDSGLWPYLSAAFAGLWLLTLIAWWRARQIKPVLEGHQQQAQQQLAVKASSARQACKKACAANAAPEAIESILGWAQSAWQEPGINSLGQVINITDSDALKQQLIQLERAQYSEQAGAWSGDSLWQLLAKGWPDRGGDALSTNNTSALPDLYPQST